MPNRIAGLALALLLATGAAGAATLERADELYLAGDLDGARNELGELLASDLDDTSRSVALGLLGRIEVDRKDWAAALEAWGELTDRYALTPAAIAISPALRPLQALVACGCETLEPLEASPPVIAEVPPARASAPVEPTDGTLLVGGWGAEYDPSQEATAAIIEFLEANGVAVRAASTEIPAVRGEEVVLSYLLEEARAAGAAGVLFVTTRFDYREYIQASRYDPSGAQIWKEKLIGGTALKERQNRGKVSWALVERMNKRLAKRLGSDDLPTQ